MAMSQITHHTHPQLLPGSRPTPYSTPGQEAATMSQLTGTQPLLAGLTLPCTVHLISNYGSHAIMLCDLSRVIELAKHNPRSTLCT